MTAQKEEWALVRLCDVETRIHTLSLQLLEKYFVLCFLTFRIINNRCKVVVNFILLRMSDLPPAIEDSENGFCNDVTAQLGPIVPFAWLF